MRIRRATLDDAGALILLARAMFEESRYAKLTQWNDAKAGNSIYRVLMSPRTVVFVAEEGAAVVGFLQGGLIEYAYSEDVYVKGEHLFVLPSHRASRAACELIEAFERWADDFQPTERLLGITTGVHAALFGRFVQRQGYQPCGWVYTKEAGNV